MKFVIPGGTGQIGNILRRELVARGHQVVVISRQAADPTLRWDGRSDGPWMEAIDGADVVVNLAGRTVNCRYNWVNLNQMMASRIDSTLAVGRAIAKAERPPAVWLQQSTATIYPHAKDSGPFDEDSSVDGLPTNVPAYWSYSVHIARAWELALASCETPNTRKVALRTAFTMSPDSGGVFDWLLWLVDRGIGGPFCGGQQFVSWISDIDYARAILHLVDHDIEGPVNLSAPEPLPNAEFMAELRRLASPRVALPITGWMARIGAWWLQTDTELMLKSRRALPKRLLESGFEFTHRTWSEAAPDLVARMRADAA